MKEVMELVNEYYDVKNDLYIRLEKVFPYLSVEHIDEYSRLYSEIIESDFTMSHIISIVDYYISDICDLFRLDKYNITNIRFCDSRVVNNRFRLVLKFDTIVNEENISLITCVFISKNKGRDCDYCFAIYLCNKSNNLSCKVVYKEAEKYKSQNYNIVDIINDKNLCKIFSDAVSYSNKVDEFIEKNMKFDDIDIVVNNDNRENIIYSLSNIFEVSDRDSMNKIIEYSYYKLTDIDSSLVNKKAECTNIVFVKKGSIFNYAYIRFIITFKIDGVSYDMCTDGYYLYNDEISSKLLKIKKEDK